MAFSERLAFVLQLSADGAIRGFGQLRATATRDLGAVDDRLDRIGGRMQVAGAGAVAFAGIAGRALYGFAQASEEANLSSLQLQNTLDNQPQLAGESAEAFTDLADAIQDKTAADGDQIVSAMAMLGTFRLTGDEIRNLTPLVVDYARKFNVDLVSAAVQVGKAMDGQSTALRRNGVSIDEALFATDRYAAVTQALRDQVGGFAEQEGETFAGSIERLKNQLGDLAEGIGTGVVSAFTDMLGPVQGAVNAFGELDPAAQSSLGRIATFTTVGVGAAGAASLLAGSVLKARDNLSGMANMLNLSAKAQGRLTTAAKGLGALGVAATIMEIADAARAGSESVSAMADDIGRLADEELASAFRDLANQNENLRGDLDKIVPPLEIVENQFRDLAEANLGTAQRMRDAVAAAGEERDVIAAMDVVLRDAARGSQQLAADQQASTEAIQDGTTATGDAADATDDATEARGRSREAIDRERRALERFTEAQQASLGNQLDLASAEIAAVRALEEYRAALTDVEASELDRREAGIRLLESYMAQGEAAKQAAEDQAVASGDAANAAEIGAQAQIESLLRVAENLEPGSELRTQLDGYIWTLANNVPSRVDTTFVANTQQAVRDIQALQRLAAGVGENSYEVNFHALPGSGPDGRKADSGVTVNMTVNGNLTAEQEAAAREIARRAAGEVTRQIAYAVRV